MRAYCKLVEDIVVRIREGGGKKMSSLSFAFQRGNLVSRVWEVVNPAVFPCQLQPVV